MRLLSNAELKQEPIYVARVLRALAHRHSDAGSFVPSWSYDRGLYARFRRWRPGTSTLDMENAVWKACSPEVRELERYTDEQKAQAVQRAAVAAALVAAATPAETRLDAKESAPLGAVLLNAGLSDLRLMRLLTERPERRIEALRRVLVRARQAGHTVRWLPRRPKDDKRQQKPEVARILAFLYGNRNAAKRAADDWAHAFFRADAVASKPAASSEAP